MVISLLVLLVYIGISLRAYFSVGSSFWSFVAGINAVVGLILAVRGELKFSPLRGYFGPVVKQIKQFISGSHSTGVSIDTSKLQDFLPVLGQILYKYVFPLSLLRMIRNSIGLRISGESYISTWILSLVFVLISGFFSQSSLQASGIKLGEYAVTKTTWIALISYALSIFIAKYFFSTVGNSPWFYLIAVLIGLGVYYIVYTLYSGQSSSRFNSVWTKLFLFVGGFTLLRGFYQNTMTRLDTQTIEKIVYRDLEVVDASLFDTNNGKTKEDADVVDVDTSGLDTILNQPEPTTSIASKLLKAVGEEVIDDEILEEIKDPELKQLMLQNQLRKLMAQDKTHSASPSQPYVISPDILK